MTNGQPLWRVGVPVQTQVYDQQKGYVAGWQIPVIMADKATFTVQVTADEFTPENVQKVIEDHVERLGEIRNLQGEPI
jgi:hypothetical protein